MKKNSFIQGAFIATMGIVLSKILGIIYVIPFYAIIGDKGGALYGYGYAIYSIFLGISSAGIPLAMSKIISEYNVLGYYDAKERAFKIGKSALTLLGLLSFIVLMIFARPIAIMIIGDVKGGNTIEDITFVIRVISSAILVVPVLSIYRGYLQGHKYITPTSISQVLEQVVRVTIIIVGSYLSLKVFNLSLTMTVGIAVFSATIGASVSCVYLVLKTKKYKKQLNEKEITTKEPYIPNKDILKTILIYAFPFVMIDVFKSIYTSVDMFMLVKILVEQLGYTVSKAETIMSIFSTWGLKLRMIVVSISTGVMVSLIPTLSSSFAKQDMLDVRKKINQTFQVILYLVIPMSVGLSILSKPIWTVFYGYSDLGSAVFSTFIFTSIAVILFLVSVMIVQILKGYKVVFISLVVGLVTKIVINAPLIVLFENIGLKAYNGSIVATIIGYLICSVICLVYLNKKFEVNYKDTINKVFKMVLSVIIMSIVLFGFSYLVPLNLTSKLINILVICLYTLVGGITYLVITYKTGILYGIFGKNLINKILTKLRLKK